jgi:membrane protein required for colicin V production
LDACAAAPKTKGPSSRANRQKGRRIMRADSKRAALSRGLLFILISYVVSRESQKLRQNDGLDNAFPDVRILSDRLFRRANLGRKPFGGRCRHGWHVWAMSLNPFDAVIYLLMVVAVVMGTHSGLLRSLATIFGYLSAMPIAVAMSPALSRILADQLQMRQVQNWELVCAVFFVAGVVLSALFRVAVSELFGTDVSIPDRLAGALLGAVRIGLLAVLMVMVFDRVIPAGREPEFLSGSRLRPLLATVGARTLQSLPPDVADYIDRLKQQQGI